MKRPISLFPLDRWTIRCNLPQLRGAHSCAVRFIQFAINWYSICTQQEPAEEQGGSLAVNLAGIKKQQESIFRNHLDWRAIKLILLRFFNLVQIFLYRFRETIVSND